MEILKEWFLWGESDLFFWGLGIIIIAFFFPYRTRKKKQRKVAIIIGLLIYAICEVVVSITTSSYLWIFLCLFIGGISLCICIGRIARMLFIKLFGKKKATRKRRPVTKEEA